MNGKHIGIIPLVSYEYYLFIFCNIDPHSGFFRAHNCAWGIFYSIVDMIWQVQIWWIGLPARWHSRSVSALTQPPPFLWCACQTGRIFFHPSMQTQAHNRLHGQRPTKVLPYPPEPDKSLLGLLQGLAGSANAHFSSVIASQDRNGGCYGLFSGGSWTPAASP